jgi:hypothetical protein
MKAELARSSSSSNRPALDDDAPICAGGCRHLTMLGASRWRCERTGAVMMPPGVVRPCPIFERVVEQVTVVAEKVEVVESSDFDSQAFFDKVSTIVADERAKSLRPKQEGVEQTMHDVGTIGKTLWRLLTDD